MEEEEKPVIAKKKGKAAGDWLKDGSFYLHGGIYMFVRLAMNLAMTVIPFYLTVVLGVDEPSPEGGSPLIVAMVPLVSFLASAIFSIFLYNRVIAYFGNRLIPLFLGSLTIAAGSLPFLFMQPSFRWLIFICASIQGIGLGTLLNTATSIISDVIGDDGESSAFVYGVYSLFDKFSSGIVLFVMTKWFLEKPTPLRIIAGIIPTASGLLAFLLCWLGQKMYANRLRALSVRKVRK